MDHNEIMLNVPLLAAGTLDPDESALIQTHLAECQECQHAFDEYQALLLGLIPVVSDIDESGKDAMRAKFKARLVENRRQSTTAALSRPRRLIPGRVAWGWAAALIVAIGGWGTAYHYQQAAHQKESVLQLMATGKLLSLAATTDAYRAALYLQDGKAVVWASDLPALKPGHIYEGWWIEKGRPVRAAIFNRRPTVLAVPTPHPEAFAITIEPAGGTSAPTTSVLVAGSLNS